MGIISKSILCAESESSHIKGQSYQDFAEKWLFWLCLRLCVELKIIPPFQKTTEKVERNKGDSWVKNLSQKSFIWKFKKLHSLRMEEFTHIKISQRFP